MVCMVKWLTDQFFQPTSAPSLKLNRDYRIVDDDTGQSIVILTGPYTGTQYRYQWSYLTEDLGCATLHFATEFVISPSSHELDSLFNTIAGDILCAMIEDKEIYVPTRFDYPTASGLS